MLLGCEVFRPVALPRCERCKEVIDAGKVEFCHVCFGDLCYDCWSEHGECGHAEKGVPAKPSWPACTRCGSTDTERVGGKGMCLCGECGGIFWSRVEGGS